VVAGCVESGAAAGVEKRRVLHDHDSRTDGVETRPATLEDLVAGAQRIVEHRTVLRLPFAGQLLARQRSGAAVDG
jgi:hypothetical protein